MMFGVLIFCFSLIFLVTFISILKKDYFFAGFYFFLYVYTIFTQIGYVYFPALSDLLKANFGSELFYSYFVFVLLSFLSFYAMFKLFYPICVRENRYVVVKARYNWRAMFYVVIFAHFWVLFAFFLKNYNILSYHTIVENKTFFHDKQWAYNCFMINFKLSVFFNFVLYYCYRLRGVFNFKLQTRFFLLIILIIGLLLFALISKKIGNRTDILALVTAIVFFEINFVRKGDFRKKMVKIGLFVLLVLLWMLLIEHTRGKAVSDFTLAERMLFKDYYTPSYILIAAIKFGYVSFLEVLKSSLANILVLIDYPYLQTTITDFFHPGVSSRNTGYAFFIFTEGYVAMGMSGFVYNGIVVFLYIALWRNFACSNKSYYNLFMLSLMSSQFANICRSQTSYFIKDIYMWFIPAMILLYLIVGIRPSLLRKSMLTTNG